MASSPDGHAKAERSKRLPASDEAGFNATRECATALARIGAWEALGIVENQNVVVVGGAGDIGRAVAALFAREGARLVIADAGVSREGSGEERERVDGLIDQLKRTGAEASPYYEPIVSADSARRLVEACVDRHGRLDTLIHCAGVQLDQSIGKVDEQSFDRLMSVHVKGTLFATQAAASQMRRQKAPGKIVNTTSQAGLLGNYGQLGYSAASAAIYGMTRTASIELQRFDITVNAVAPIAKTRQTAELPMFEHVETMTPEHVAPAYLYLGSSLSRDLSGIVLAVAGAKLSVLGVVESSGQFKEDADGVWSAMEISEHWEPISKI